MARFMTPRVLALSLTVTATTIARDFEWIGGVSQDWCDSGNWQFDGAPTTDVPGCDVEGANVCIPGGDQIQVMCAGGTAVMLGSLDSQSSLEIAVALTMNGPSSITDPCSVGMFDIFANSLLEFEGVQGILDTGDLDGTGAIVNNGTLTLDGVDINIDFTNNGTINHTNDLFLGPGLGADDPVLTNNGMWKGQKGISETGATDTTFELNGGTVMGTGPDPLRFTIKLNTSDQGGTIHAQSGDVRISLGGRYDGTGQFTADMDRAIIVDQFPGVDAMRIVGDWTASGAGEMRIEHKLFMQEGGTFTANLSGANGLVLDDGEIDVDDRQDSFQNTSTMTWRGGTFCSIGAGESSNNSAVGTIRITGGGNVTPTIVTGSTFLNEGTIRQQVDTNIDGATLVNSGGIVELAGGRLLGSTGALNNINGGLVVRPIDAEGSFSEIVSACNLTDSQMLCEQGELRVSGGGMWSNRSSVEVEADAVISLRSQDVETFQQGNGLPLKLTGDGEVHIRNARLVCALVSNQLGMDDSPGFFRLGEAGQGGSIVGTFNNEGDFRWRSGSIGEVNDDSIVNTGTVRTEAANNGIRGQLGNAGHFIMDHSVQVRPDALLTNNVDGVIDQTNATLTLIAADSVVDQRGIWNLQGPSNVNGVGPIKVFGGTLVKSGTGTTSTISAPFEMQAGKVATVTAESGTLVISNPQGDFDGIRWEIVGGGVIRLPNETYDADNAPLENVISHIQGVISLAADGVAPPRFECQTFNNNGRIRPGGEEDTVELVIDADLNQLPDGILSFNIAGPVAGESHDRLTVEGNVTLDGTLRIDLLDGFVPTIGQSFTVATATGTMTGVFADVIGDGTWSAEVIGSDLVVTLTALPTCAADLNGDGDVGPADLAGLLDQWGFAPSSTADLNGDDMVGPADLAALLDGWGACE